MHRGFTCVALLLAACASSVDPAATADPRPAPRLAVVGSDVSALARLESLGARYRDAGPSDDALRLLSAAGHTMFRLRLFVAPNGTGVEVNDLAYTLAMAARVRAAGASLWLALHYSDTWADPGQQATPAAWRGGSLEALERTVESYTADVLRQFRTAGVVPRVVQIGNEIDGGFLWPQGRLGGTGAEALASRAAFGRLLRAGVRGVRQVVASPDTTLVALHVSHGGDSAATRWFFDQVAAEGVAYDVVALSYYPWWHGRLDELAATLEATSRRLDRDVYVIETAYPWRGDWRPPADARRAGDAMPWPFTPEGQAAFSRQLAATVAAAPRGRGVLWWYPEAVPVPGVEIWAGGALGLFDAGGRLLPAARAIR